MSALGEAVRGLERPTDGEIDALAAVVEAAEHKHFKHAECVLTGDECPVCGLQDALTALRDALGVGR